MRITAILTQQKKLGSIEQGNEIKEWNYNIESVF